MKFIRDMILSLLVFGVMLSSPAVLSAEKEKADPAFLKLLSDSAAALEAIHSDLAPEMSAFAKEEAAENESVQEPELTKEEKLTRRRTHLKLYVASATALETSNPELSAQLKKTAQLKVKHYASNPIK